MTSLANHQSNKIVKLLLMGESGSGKTGALASLIKAGYKLRILDLDNGLDILSQLAKSKNLDLSLVEFRTLRDKYKASPVGPMIDGSPKAFIDTLNMLDRWKYTHNGEATDLGSPATWGADTVLVIDTLTFLSNAAWAWASIVKVPHGAKGQDGRAVYGEAQRALENVLGLLTSESFNTNVIVISHLTYIDREDGARKAYPTSTGQALSPKIPAYFNSLALCERKSGAAVPEIRFAPTSMIDLKSPVSFKMAASISAETALADFFKMMKG